ncbi:MAG: hypothetical protein KatS3mg131_2124 [Candidatus Tectimicrobiota bacterium]|nr:MAG: hypothetical protein KatS3mg131_2124 [Candidatus Tectomicrobia bacterium]
MHFLEGFTKRRWVVGLGDRKPSTVSQEGEKLRPVPEGRTGSAEFPVGHRIRPDAELLSCEKALVATHPFRAPHHSTFPARFGEALPHNAAMGVREIRRYCALDSAGEQLLAQAMRHFGLSARACDRICKVACTIADLAGEERIAQPTCSTAPLSAGRAVGRVALRRPPCQVHAFAASGACPGGKATRLLGAPAVSITEQR